MNPKDRPIETSKIIELIEWYEQMKEANNEQHRLDSHMDCHTCSRVLDWLSYGKEQTMKFLVDELPNFYDDCPFSKEVWTDEGWRGICTLVDERCNLHNNQCVTECYGLKELKGADNKIDYEKAIEYLQRYASYEPQTEKKI